MMNNKIKLTDEELDKVVGGVITNNDYQRKHEIELGDFVPDAYKHDDKKNKDPNNPGLINTNNSNPNPNIDNNYVPLEYEGR